MKSGKRVRDVVEGLRPVLMAGELDRVFHAAPEDCRSRERLELGSWIVLISSE